MAKILLNPELLEKQKVTPEQIEKLEDIYKYMDELFDEANKDPNLDKNGKGYAEEIRECEFRLQDNWNFGRDANKHTWWNRFKHCSCPKIDNDERFGYDKYINCNCPYHGGICNPTK